MGSKDNRTTWHLFPAYGLALFMVSSLIGFFSEKVLIDEWFAGNLDMAKTATALPVLGLIVSLIGMTGAGVGTIPGFRLKTNF